MLVKIHKTPNHRVLVSVCDTELIGKKFEEGNRQLDITPEFYKGKNMNEKDVGDLMRNAYIVNLVGKNSIALAIKEEIIDEDCILTVDGVPHAQVMIE